VAETDTPDCNDFPNPENCRDSQVTSFYSGGLAECVFFSRSFHGMKYPCNFEKNLQEPPKKKKIQHNEYASFEKAGDFWTLELVNLGMM